MKIQICLIIFFVSLLPFMYGQNQDVMKREYGYDDAGNRVIRKVLVLSNKGEKSLSSSQNDFQDEESESIQDDFLADKAADISLKIYPNPTTTTVTIEVDNSIDAVDGMITVYNLSGVQIGTQKANSTSTKIDLSSFSSGSYLITIQINGRTTYWKIIKQ